MKKWFDDYNVKMRPYAGRRQTITWKGYGKNGEDVDRYFKIAKPNGRYVVELPHSFAGKKKHIIITKNNHDDKRIMELVSILDCALYELTQSNKSLYAALGGFMVGFPELFRRKNGKKKHTAKG